MDLGAHKLEQGKGMSNNNFSVVNPNKENASSVQINNLLQTIAVLTQSVREVPELSGGPLDGGVKTAVELSIINACTRLDAIMGDNSRWNVADYVALSATMQSMYDENTKLIQEQRAAYAEASSAHNKYKPQLVRLTNGKWLAISGNMNDIDNALVGLGDCPADAIAAFDDMFRGQVNDKVAAIIETDKNEKSKQQTVDGIGTEGPTQPKKCRRKRRGHSDSAGSDSSLSLD
jgi:hypothetical protein